MDDVSHRSSTGQPVQKGQSAGTQLLEIVIFQTFQSLNIAWNFFHD